MPISDAGAASLFFFFRMRVCWAEGPHYYESATMLAPALEF